MDKGFAGGGLLFGIVVGLLLHNLALGIVFGLIVGGGAGAARARTIR